MTVKIHGALGPFSPDFRPDSLNNTPSIRHGLTPEEERAERKEGVEFLMNCAHQLRLPYNAACTAAVYFQKFYMRRSFKVHSKWDTAAACLYLAAKSEETRKHCSAVAETCHFIRFKQVAPDPRSHPSEHAVLVKRVLDKELILLQTIEFNFQVSLPHIYLPVVYEWFKANFPQIKDGKLQKSCQISWFFLMDSYKLPVILFYPPQWIALACIELAIRYESRGGNPSDPKLLNPNVLWYKTHAKDLPVEDFENLCLLLLTASDVEDGELKFQLKQRRRGSPKSIF